MTSAARDSTPTTPPGTPSNSGTISTPLLLTLALLSAVAPFATDLYLPGLPQIVGDLDTTTSGAQLSLTAFLIGAAVGQVIFGPLSDRLGRRGPLLLGTLIYLLCSIGTALAPSLWLLITLRLIQGITGAAGMVIGRAVISDRYHGSEAARALSLMMIVGGVAPVIAPFLGSTLADPIGWRGLLWIVAGLGLLALVCSLIFVPETHGPAERKRQAAAPAAADQDPSATTVTAATTQPGTLRRLFSRPYLTATLAFAFGFTTMMAYISASPFLYQNLMGLGTVQYGLLFGLNALVLMLVSMVAANLTRRFRIRSAARVGLGINLLGVLVFGLLVLVDAPPLSLAVPLVFVVGSLGLVLGNATALAMDAVPGAAGSASALLGFLQFGLAGIASPLVGLGGDMDAAPLAVTMLVASVIGNLAIAACPTKI
jgi:DHA1 family bicyclomycin/chloramphenicol resistance-like MFS transporter